MPQDSDVICERLLPKLAGVVDGDTTLSKSDTAHVETCLRCQAEVVSYRKLLRAMHGLRTQVVQPSPSVLAGILDRLGEKAERRAVRSLLTNKRIAYGSALTIVAGAGVAGAILFSGRGKGKARKAA